MSVWKGATPDVRSWGTSGKCTEKIQNDYHGKFKNN